MSLFDQWQSLTAEQRAKFKDETDYVKERDLEQMFRDSLDECYEPYKIGELTFSASDVLDSCDPVAYRCAYADYCSEREDLIELDGEYYEERDLENFIEQREVESDSP